MADLTPSTETEHARAAHGKVGVLLVNLGTPDGTDYWSVRRFLSEFLSDPRVVELPKVLWQIILQGPILTFRPGKSAKAYKKIWMPEGSPLMVYTRAQARLLADRMSGDDLIVDYAMTYGQPSIASKIETLKISDCDRIAVLALYPQYSATTTASVYDRTFNALKKLRWQPAVRTAAAFYDRPTYVEALAKSLEAHLAGLDYKPDRVLMSYHGIPEACIAAGDPYYDQCRETTRLVVEKLGWDSDFAMTTFQSRFGPTDWLKPYTDDVLKTLPGEGHKKIAVISPAFISDCLETLEELAILGKEQFETAGGTHFSVVPCLNDSAAAIDVIEDVVRTEIAGWV